MLITFALGLAVGASATLSFIVAIALASIHYAAVMADSGALTAGTVAAARSGQRGATLAVHSMLGYAGGFIGPLAVGWTLDLSGGMSPPAWAAAFSMIAVLTLLALIAFWMMRPRELAGDRHHSR